MSETMIERVSKIVRAGNEGGWGYDAIAYLVIEAMEKPTKAMILAGVHHDNLGDMEGRWMAMISAALSPPSNGEK